MIPRRQEHFRVSRYPGTTSATLIGRSVPGRFHPFITIHRHRSLGPHITLGHLQFTKKIWRLTFSRSVRSLQHPLLLTLLHAVSSERWVNTKILTSEFFRRNLREIRYISEVTAAGLRHAFSSNWREVVLSPALCHCPCPSHACAYMYALRKT